VSAQTYTVGVSQTALALLAQGSPGRVALLDLCLENDNVDTAITALVRRMQVDGDAYHARNLPNIKPSYFVTGKVTSGKQRFVRITEEDDRNVDAGLPPSRYVVCFVERFTGLIWKAATFKGPALNFPRGNVWLLPKTVNGRGIDSGTALVKGYTAQGRPL
jgi:hypothetical protein